MDLTEIFYYGGMVTMGSAFLLFLFFQVLWIGCRRRLNRKFKKEYGVGGKDG